MITKAKQTKNSVEDAGRATTKYQAAKAKPSGTRNRSSLVGTLRNAKARIVVHLELAVHLRQKLAARPGGRQRFQFTRKVIALLGEDLKLAAAGRLVLFGSVRAIHLLTHV